MLDLWSLAPGDIIVHDLCAEFDADVPLMVIACHPDVSRSWGVMYRVLALYMVKSGAAHIRQIEIDSNDAREYRWLIRLHGPAGAKPTARGLG